MATINTTAGGVRGRASSAREPVQVVAGVVGAVFLLVGVLGFVPGVTTNFDDLSFASHHSGAELLGLFQVSVLHNVVHILFGVAGLALARTAGRSAGFLMGGGLVYIVLALYGSAIEHESALNFVPVNAADNWLHLGLGTAMIALGAALYSRRSTD
jgi:hypothetical protein